VSVTLHQVAVPNPASAAGGGTSGTSLDLWYVDLDVSADTFDSCSDCLSPDELARAERLHSDLQRIRYVAGRAALRHVLAERLDCSPAAVRLCYGRNGKPQLAHGDAPLEFNLAHSGGDAVIAITGSGAVVGVDIELRRPIAGVEALARLVFSDPERRELELASDPVAAFLNGWTRKEAYVKALGLGLSAPLEQITVSLSGSATLLSTGLREQSPSDWSLFNVPHLRAVVAAALGPKGGR